MISLLNFLFDFLLINRRTVTVFKIICACLFLYFFYQSCLTSLTTLHYSEDFLDSYSPFKLFILITVDFAAGIFDLFLKIMSCISDVPLVLHYMRTYHFSHLELRSYPLHINDTYQLDKSLVHLNFPKVLLLFFYGELLYFFMRRKSIIIKLSFLSQFNAFYFKIFSIFKFYILFAFFIMICVFFYEFQINNFITTTFEIINILKDNLFETCVEIKDVYLYYMINNVLYQEFQIYFIQYLDLFFGEKGKLMEEFYCDYFVFYLLYSLTYILCMFLLKLVFIFIFFCCCILYTLFFFFSYFFYFIDNFFEIILKILITTEKKEGVNLIKSISNDIRLYCIDFISNNILTVAYQNTSSNLQYLISNSLDLKNGQVVQFIPEFKLEQNSFSKTMEAWRKQKQTITEFPLDKKYNYQSINPIRKISLAKQYGFTKRESMLYLQTLSNVQRVQCRTDLFNLFYYTGCRRRLRSKLPMNLHRMTRFFLLKTGRLERLLEYLGLYESFFPFETVPVNKHVILAESMGNKPIFSWKEMSFPKQNEFCNKYHLFFNEAILNKIQKIHGFAHEQLFKKHYLDYNSFAPAQVAAYGYGVDKYGNPMVDFRCIDIYNLPIDNVFKKLQNKDQYKKYGKYFIKSEFYTELVEKRKRRKYYRYKHLNYYTLQYRKKIKKGLKLKYYVIKDNFKFMDMETHYYRRPLFKLDVFYNEDWSSKQDKNDWKKYPLFKSDIFSSYYDLSVLLKPKHYISKGLIPAKSTNHLSNYSKQMRDYHSREVENDLLEHLFHDYHLLKDHFDYLATPMFDFRWYYEQPLAYDSMISTQGRYIAHRYWKFKSSIKQTLGYNISLDDFLTINRSELTRGVTPSHRILRFPRMAIGHLFTVRYFPCIEMMNILFNGNLMTSYKVKNLGEHSYLSPLQISKNKNILQNWFVHKESNTKNLSFLYSLMQEIDIGYNKNVYNWLNERINLIELSTNKKFNLKKYNYDNDFDVMNNNLIDIYQYGNKINIQIALKKHNMIKYIQYKENYIIKEKQGLVKEKQRNLYRTMNYKKNKLFESIFTDMLKLTPEQKKNKLFIFLERTGEFFPHEKIVERFEKYYASIAASLEKKRQRDSEAAIKAINERFLRKKR